MECNNDYNGCNVAIKITVQEKVVEAQLTSSESSDWVDSDGNPHYYENDPKYVGTREGQHMTAEQAQDVAEHGMA